MEKVAARFSPPPLKDVASALGVKSKRLRGQLGHMAGPEGSPKIRAVMKAKEKGVLSADQANRLIQANRQAMKHMAAQKRKSTAAEGILGKEKPDYLRTAKRVGVAGAIGFPALAVTSGAGQGVQQGMDVPPQAY